MTKEKRKLRDDCFGRNEQQRATIIVVCLKHLDDIISGCLFLYTFFMLITVPATSAQLSTLLSPAQNDQMSKFPGIKQCELQNLGATDIYVEFGATASDLVSRKVLATTGTIAWNSSDLSRVNVIAPSGANANVRLTINS
jgi:hypothetical protein